MNHLLTAIFYLYLGNAAPETLVTPNYHDFATPQQYATAMRAYIDKGNWASPSEDDMWIWELTKQDL